MAVRVLFSTGSLYVLDVAYAFELAAEAGYDGIEIMGDERWSTRDPLYLKRLAASSGLPVLVAHTPFSARTPGWAEAENEIRRIGYTLELAEALRAETIVVHVPRKRGQITLQVGRKTWKFPWRAVDDAVKGWIEHDLPGVQQRTKVKIAIENMPVSRIAGQAINAHWWNEVETWSQVHQWLTLDTTHWGTMRLDPLDAYRAAGARVCHVHLSNYDGHEHRLPQKGNLNLKLFLRALATDNFQGTVSLELNPGSLSFKEPATLRRNLRDSLTFCREHLG